MFSADFWSLINAKALILAWKKLRDMEERILRGESVARPSKVEVRNQEERVEWGFTEEDERRRDGEQEDVYAVRMLPSETDPYGDEDDALWSPKDEDEEQKLLVDGRVSKFQAEIKVLDALAKPRKNLAKEDLSLVRNVEEKPWLTPEEAKLDRLERMDHILMNKEELNRFRSDIPIDVRRAENTAAVEQDSVLVLPRHMREASSSTNFSKVAKMSKNRQMRHDEALRIFRENIASLSEKLEQNVINTGRELRDTLAESDAQLSSLKFQLEDNQKLRLEEYEFLSQAMTRVQTLCEERRKKIENFDAFMEAVELERSEVGSKLLTKLVEELTAISYKLPGDIERIALIEGYEINAVVIENTKSRCELVSRMLCKNVLVFYQGKRHWLLAETKWRQLRHERALRDWECLLDSKQFREPKQRNYTLCQLFEKQKSHHKNGRLTIFSCLKDLIPKVEEVWNLGSIPQRIDDFTPERVQQILSQLNENAEAETESSKAALESLNLEHENLKKELRQSKEILRAELHSFAHLTPSGDIFTVGDRGKNSQHRIRLGFLLEAEDLKEILRNGGSLKQELCEVVELLGNPNLIYNERVDVLVEKLRLLKDSFEVLEIYEKEGKSSELKALYDLLDKVRTGSKADAESQLPNLFARIVKLKSTVGGKDTLLGRVVSDCLVQLEGIDPSLDQVEKAHDKEEELSSGDPMLAYKTRDVDIVALQKVHNKISSIVNACRLPMELREELRQTLESVENQHYVNEIVDGIVNKFCDEAITKRMKEYDVQFEFWSQRADAQNEQLRNGTTALLSFLLKASSLIREFSDLDFKQDVEFESRVETLLEEFQKSTAERENSFSDLAEKIRQSPDSKTLDDYFEKSLLLLQAIEDSYRSYADQGCTLARQHCREADEQGFIHLDRLAKHFGLRFHDLRKRESSAPQLDNPQGDANCPEDQDLQDIQESEHASSVEKKGKEEDAETTPEVEQEQSEAVIQDNLAEEDGNEMSSASEEEHKEEGEGAVQSTLDESEISEKESAQLLQIGGVFKFEIVESAAKVAEKILSGVELQDEEELETIMESEETKDGSGVSGNHIQSDDKAQELMAENSEEDQEAESKEMKYDGTAALEEDSLEQENCVAQIEPGLTPEWNEVELEMDVVASIIELFRDSVVAIKSNMSFQRAEEMNSIAEERVEGLSEELEERLRLHWPRKGRIDMKYRQPRARELVQHRKKHDRHVRAFKMKSKAQNEKFERQCEKVEALFGKFKQTMQAFSLHLESQTNVAALQGVAKRGRQAAAELQEEMQEAKELMMPLIRRNNDLLEMNERFVANCVTIEEGGEYHRDEIELERIDLGRIQDCLIAEVNKRAERLKETFERISKTRTETLEEFLNKFEKSLQTLSIREGLGRKYGAPRRGAQEKLRSEIALSTTAEKHIEENLKELSVLASCTSSVSETNGKMSEAIKLCIDTICKCLWRRGKYLQIFNDSSKVPQPGMHDLRDIPGKEALPGFSENDVTLRMGTTTNLDEVFWIIVEESTAQCKKETLSLYEEEGLMETLKEAGKPWKDEDVLLPESLVTFLEAFEERARAYQVEASIKFRDQVVRLQETLVEVPSKALDDIFERTTAKVSANLTKVSKHLSIAIEMYEQMRRSHDQKLRPALGDENHVEELEKLCASEALRHNELEVKIDEAQKARVRILYDESTSFMIAFGNTCKILFLLLDTLVQQSDFRMLPGDEVVATKRMNLRKLRNARLKEMDDPTAHGKQATISRGIKLKVFDAANVEKAMHLRKKIMDTMKEMNIEYDEADLPQLDSFETIATAQHQALIDARDQVLEQFQIWFEEEVMTCQKSHEKDKSDEEQRNLLWNKQITVLKNL